MTAFLEADFYSFDATQAESLAQIVTGMLHGDHTPVSEGVDALTALDPEIVTEGLHALILELLPTLGFTTETTPEAVDAFALKMISVFDTPLYAPAPDDAARLIKALLGLSAEAPAQLGFSHLGQLFLTLGVVSGCAGEAALCAGVPVATLVFDTTSTLTWYC